jgi:hypothetical protein
MEIKPITYIKIVSQWLPFQKEDFIKNKKLKGLNTLFNKDQKYLKTQTLPKSRE